MAGHGVFNIVAAGEITVIASTNDNKVTFNINGIFSGGTLVAGYKNSSGVFEPYVPDAAIATAGQLTIHSGLGVEIMFSLTGVASPPNIFIEVHRHTD